MLRFLFLKDMTLFVYIKIKGLRNIQNGYFINYLNKIISIKYLFLNEFLIIILI